LSVQRSEANAMEPNGYERDFRVVCVWITTIIKFLKRRAH
jgi:hypothetical protein